MASNGGMHIEKINAVGAFERSEANRFTADRRDQHELLAELRRTHPMVRVSFAGLPTVTLTDGSQMIVTSLDYMVETPRIAQMLARHRAEFASNATTFVTLGRVSTGLDQQLLTAGIVVMHHRLGDEAFNAKAEKAAQLAQKTATPEALRSKSP